MKEILFRAKRYDSGEWVYGYYLRRDTESDETYHCFFTTDGCMYDVDNDTVGQFTGLQDQNGNKIFEGDIIQYCERNLVVWWNDEAFQWQAKSISGYDVITFEVHGCPEWTNIDLGWIASERAIIGRMDTKIIGNKWDNPELLNP